MEIEKSRSLNILDKFIFNETEHHVTIIWENGEPLFRAADIGKILDIKDWRSVTRDYEPDEKGMRSMHTLGGLQQVLVLTENGLYRLLFNSRKPIAKPFQRWVASVVREIQRNGEYVIKNLQDQISEYQKKDEAKNIALVKAYHLREVVYFGKIKDLDGKMIVKIGQTKDIWTTFTERHPASYGQIELLNAIECQLNEQFEYFLLHHANIKKFKYDGIVKLDGTKSNEIIQVTEKELEDVYSIAKANVSKFRTAVEIQDDVIEIMSELKDALKGEIKNEVGKQIEKHTKDIMDLFRKELQQLRPVDNTIDAEPVKPKKTRKRVRIRESGTGKCLGCEAKITVQAKFCVDCVKGNQEKKFDISREELYELVHVKQIPYTKLGLRFGVSDNAVRKRCKTLGIEIRRVKKQKQ
jgi:prophage antirepressor-like protein